MSFFCIFCKKRKAEIVNIRIKLLPLTPISSLISKFIMKKLMMMVVAALMATVNANAQFEAGTFSLQPIVGCGAATITNADNIDIAGKELKNQFTVSAMTGVEAEYQISGNISVAAGLNYTLQGTGWENYTKGGTKYKDPRMELGYVKIPLVVNCYVAKGLAIKAGVQFGFMTEAKMIMRNEFKEDRRDVTIDYSVDYKDDFEKFDLSIPFGVSYQFNNPFVIDARYQFGLTKLNKESGKGIKDLKNGVFMITFGYKFAL